MKRKVSITAIHFIRAASNLKLPSYFFAEGSTISAIERVLARQRLRSWVSRDGWDQVSGNLYQPRYKVTAGRAVADGFAPQHEFVIVTDELKRVVDGEFVENE